MNVLFDLLALIVFPIWLGAGFLWFRYMKKLPVFRKINNLDDVAFYPSLSVIIPACNEDDQQTKQGRFWRILKFNTLN